MKNIFTRYKKEILLLLLSQSGISICFGQLNVGSKIQDQTAAGRSVMLQITPDLSSATTTRRAFLLPRLTLAERDAAAFSAVAAPGLTIFNTTTNQMEFNCATAIGTPQWITGLNIYTGDGTLTAPRKLTQNSFSLSFAGSGLVNMNLGTATLGATTTLTSTASPVQIIMDNSYSNVTSSRVPKLVMDDIAGNLSGYNAYPTISGTPGALVSYANRWFHQAGNSTIFNAGNGQVVIAGVYTGMAPSDARLKTNIQSLDFGLKQILALKPKIYDKINTLEIKDGKPKITKGVDTTQSIGFIAQEAYKIMPELVDKPKDEQNNLWKINYPKIIPVLTKAIQEQQAIINTVKEDNLYAEQKIEADKARIKTLKIRLQQIERNYSIAQKQ